MASSHQTAGESAAGGDTGAEHHDNHGRSPAAWALVSLVLLGALVAAVAIVVAWVWMFILGVVVMVLGGVVGRVMAAMGLGQQSADGPHNTR